MLLAIAAILIVLWFIGFIANVGGGLIHVILVIGLIVAIVHFVQRGKSRA